ncbi:MAG: IS21-like element helper ATPase IstB [Mogibacterium sp.]|nr:IS21-like element helper ATPase IstB [Mogibacterium sp.]
MDNLGYIKASLKTIGLTHTRETLETILHDAQKEDLSYTDFLRNIADGEIRYRQDKAKEKRIKEAGFPYPKYLTDFDLNFCPALTGKQLNQLSELTWIDGLYNLIFSGPPGVGKTHLAIALGYHACERGYKVSYTNMKSLIQALRTEEIDRKSAIKMRRVRASNLLICDEVGYLPITPTEGNLFFQLVSELQEKTSIIITTNKGFEQWTEFLGDPALATAILDRLSFRCDRITMKGKSYRLENRKSFFEEAENIKKTDQNNAEGKDANNGN